MQISHWCNTVFGLMARVLTVRFYLRVRWAVHAFHSIRTVLAFSHSSRSALEFCNTPDVWHSVKIGNCSCRTPAAESDNLIPCPQAIVRDRFPSPPLPPSIEKQQILCLGILGYAVAWAGKQNRIFEVHSGENVVRVHYVFVRVYFKSKCYLQKLRKKDHNYLWILSIYVYISYTKLA